MIDAEDFKYVLVTLASIAILAGILTAGLIVSGLAMAQEFCARPSKCTFVA